MKQPTLPPAILTVFGITGDLVQRKLLPALYYLAEAKLLPDEFVIVGVTRRGTTVKEVISNVKDRINTEGKVTNTATLRWLSKRINIVTMDLTKQEEYRRLKVELDSYEVQQQVCLNRIFYLAIPAQTFGPVVEMLGVAGLNRGCQHGVAESRLLIEKPFGFDLLSAEELVELLTKHFAEDQTYRIDHFLAKETTQNILTFRSCNPLFKAVWNKQAVDYISITAAEKIGIEGRAVFYDQTGALRDIIQSHLLQLLALVTMDMPQNHTAEEVHKAKLKLLESVELIPPNQVEKRAIRGQYRSYRQEVGNPDSVTETFAMVELSINNERWSGVPILLSTGKAMAVKRTDIEVVFKDHEGQGDDINSLIIRIQPNEGIALELLAKKPGFEHRTQSVHMDFSYHRSFTDDTHPDAYERVLADALQGDRTLFTTSKEVLASWKIVEPILHSWGINSKGLESYDEGSWGPQSAVRLAGRAGVKWPPNV